MADPKPKKAMDVSAPGKSTPSATSRPIIVNHGPMMGDPMVQKDAGEEEPKSPLNTSHKVIAPATLGSVQKKVEEKSVAPKPEVPKEETKVEPPATEPPKPQPAAPTPESEQPPESSSEAEVGALAAQTKDKKKEDEVAKAEAERRAQIQKLIDEKKYFIPLSVSHHKKTRRNSIILLFILLLVAAGVGIYLMFGDALLK